MPPASVKVEDRDDGGFARFWTGVAAGVESSPSLEAAAQLFCERFYAAFAEFAVLVRVFGTLPFESLGPADRAFAREVAERAASAERLEPATPILTLLGTYGIEPQWRDRASSQGHRAIPLLSDDFVGGIPMIARLLAEIGFPKLQSSGSAWQFVRKVGREDGLFFVGDARSTTDERGRLIIPTVRFIERYGVRSVFGAGGPLAGEATFLTAIVFSRRTLLRAEAEPVVPLFANFKAGVAPLFARGAVFSP
jgi:hypothetical protein